MTLIPFERDAQSWSAAVAREDLKRYATRRGSIDLERYGRGFLYAPRNATSAADFKLPIANVYRTKAGHLVLRANRRAIQSAAAALEGARGGVELPSRARTEARRTLEAYYRRMGERPPWPPYGRGTPNPGLPAPELSCEPKPRELNSRLTWRPRDADGAQAYDGFRGARIVGAVVEYKPRVSESARRLAERYFADHGSRPPSGTRWLAWGPPFSSSSFPNQLTAGAVSAHRLLKDAKAWVERRSHSVSAGGSAQKLPVHGAQGVLPGLTDGDAASFEPPSDRPTDIPAVGTDLQPGVQWVWQPPRAGGVVMALAGVTTQGAARLAVASAALRERILPGVDTTEEVAGPDVAGAGRALVIMSGRTKADRQALANLDPSQVVDRFTEVWTELFSTEALDAYRAAHWGDEPETIEIVEPSEMAPRGTLIGMGHLVEATYETTKGGGPLTHYVHEFGEGGERPVLAFDDSKRLFIIGGTYTVTTHGIEG